MVVIDLSCETHLQFAFRGRVPVINYPLDVLVRGPFQLPMAQWVPSAYANSVTSPRTSFAMTQAELSVLELLDKRDGALDGVRHSP